MTVRVYADTSVFGGVFDTEFEEPSREFFRQVVTGRFELITSAIRRLEVVATHLACHCSIRVTSVAPLISMSRVCAC